MTPYALSHLYPVMEYRWCKEYVVFFFFSLSSDSLVLRINSQPKHL
nr:MAG TPA: hypothetical protein [Caudoviricetes sp.]